MCIRDSSIALLDIEIKNDDILEKQLWNRQYNAIIDAGINPKVTNPEIRAQLVELEKKRRKAKADKDRKGVAWVTNAEEKLKKIEAKIEELIASDASRHGNLKDIQSRKKHAKAVRKAREAILMEKIKTGVIESKAYSEMDISTSQVNKEQAYEKSLQTEEDNAMNDMSILDDNIKALNCILYTTASDEDLL